MQPSDSSKSHNTPTTTEQLIGGQLCISVGAQRDKKVTWQSILFDDRDQLMIT